MRLSITVLIFVFVGCQNRQRSIRKPELRDSLMSLYLKMADSMYWFDTLDPERKLLIAYNNNDTDFLKKAVKTANAAMKESSNYTPDPKCPKAPPINSYEFSEAYQFNYSAAFCDQVLNITVGQKNDNILLIAYHYKYIYNTDSCISLVQSTKVLSNSQWSLIKQSILRSDFWGLSRRSYKVGVDGSGLSVTGYEAPNNAFEGRYKVVIRWAAERMALGEAFKLVWDYSGVKVPCFHY